MERDQLLADEEASVKTAVGRHAQGMREKWYQRGHEDGTAWAMETATREQLGAVAEAVAATGGGVAAELQLASACTLILSESGDKKIDAEITIDHDAYVQGWAWALVEAWQFLQRVQG
jgi:hypothetical protein